MQDIFHHFLNLMLQSQALPEIGVGNAMRDVGEGSLGLILFDIALFLIGVVLVPTALKIIKSLNDILIHLITIIKTLGELCGSMKKLSDDLVEARVRDTKLENEINNLRKQIEKL